MRFDTLKYEYLSQMVEIEKEAFDTPWSIVMFIPEVADSSAHYIVGLKGDEVICYGGFHLVLDEAHITNIAVKKEYRGNGIGKILFSELLSIATLNGAKHVTLEVKDINEPAIKLYKSFGFVEEGRRPKYYNNLHDAIIMWKHY